MGTTDMVRFTLNRVNRDYPITSGHEIDIWHQNSGRILQYGRLWNFYKGQQWNYVPEAGEPVTTANFVQLFVDKHAQYLFGSPFEVHCNFRGNNAIDTAGLLNEEWEKNDVAGLGFQMAQVGGVTGDLWLNFGLDEDVIFGDRIKMTVFPSEYVFPIFQRRSDLNPSAILVQWPDSEVVSNAFGKLRVRTFVSGQYWTKQQVWELRDGVPINDPRPNLLGEFPWVHVPNLRVGNEFWGMSDIGQIIDINRELNERITDIGDIINYHGCFPVDTEALTRQGWRRHNEIQVGDDLLCLDPDSDEIVWRPAEAVQVFNYAGDLIQWDNHMDALSTPNHRWLAERRCGRPENRRYVRQMARTSDAAEGEPAVGDLYGGRLVLGGGIPAQFPSTTAYDDEEVETVGWYITEGWTGAGGTLANPATILAQSEEVNATRVEDIRRLQAYWKNRGETFTEQSPRKNGVTCWYLGTNLTQRLKELAPEKSLQPAFLTSLTYRQAELLYRVLIDGDGHRRRKETVWYQNNASRIDGFQMLAALLGKRTRAISNCRGDGVVGVYSRRTVEVENTLQREKRVPYTGQVWCPTVATGVWFARRNGSTYWTGNSPVTVVIGAKASNLQKGAKKIWSLTNPQATVQNLELSGDLGAANTHLSNLKDTLFQLGNMPKAAFGGDAISNTSGVAIALQFAPILEHMKKRRIAYGKGIQMANYLILRIKEILGTYRANGRPMPHYSAVKWPDPLPRDKQMRLNELQIMKQMQLLSRLRILRELIHNDIAPAELEVQDAQEVLDEALQEELTYSQLLGQVEAENKAAAGAGGGGGGGGGGSKMGGMGTPKTSTAAAEDHSRKQQQKAEAGAAVA